MGGEVNNYECIREKKMGYSEKLINAELGTKERMKRQRDRARRKRKGSQKEIKERKWR